jgi:hypothetical protein
MSAEHCALRAANEVFEPSWTERLMALWRRLCRKEDVL